MAGFLDRVYGCVSFRKGDLAGKMCNRPFAEAMVYEHGILINVLTGSKERIVKDLFDIYGFQFQTAPSIFGGRTKQLTKELTLTWWSGTRAVLRVWPPRWDTLDSQPGL